MVAWEMWRARGPDGMCLFQATEFLAASQVASFFSHQSVAVHESDPDEMDVQASEEESNFSWAKEAVEIIQLQHPLVYDQYNLCAMAMEGTLKNLKLPMLQYMRRPGTRYTSPTCAQKGSIFGASGWHY